MGYEDVRVKGKINDADRCSLCGRLCSIDLFIETKCYHLFCAECFASYLKRNGKSGEIRDESNYTRPYSPVRCPVSSRILQHKHSKGALYLKMKQYFRLSQYQIKCEFFPVGCYTEVKANKLAQHYHQCFFTSRRVRDELDKDHYLFQPDYTNNQLYEDVRLRTEPINNSLSKRNTNWMALGNALRNDSRGDCNGSFTSAEASVNEFKRESYKNSAHNLIDLRSECAYEIDEQLLLASKKEEVEPANRRTTGSLMSASSIDLVGNNQTLFDCLMENAKPAGSTASLKSGDFEELSRQLDLIQKNVNFIKEQMLPSYDD